MEVRGGRGRRVREAACAVLASAFLATAFVATSAVLAAAGADTTIAVVVESRVETERSDVTAPSSSTTPATTPATTPVTTPATTPPATPVTTPATPETTPATTPETAPTTSILADQPVAPAADGVAMPSNQSSCPNDLQGSVMTMEMLDISFSCPVYAGGQSVIDAGVATMITARESSLPLADHPGGAGTLWIAGHRSSHGAPFAAVPDLADGAVITVSDGSSTASYVIVGRSYVEVRDGLAVDAAGQATETATSDAVLRPDRNVEIAARLLLQTCDGENFRWMIYADLIAA